MPQLPHDVTDLALAPVALALDAALESYAGLNDEEITYRIALETDHQPRALEQRAAAVLEALVRYVDLHGWQLGWTDRGLRMTHGPHTVTLGLPANLRSYLALGTAPRVRVH